MRESASGTAQSLPGNFRTYLKLIALQVALTVGQPQILPVMHRTAAGFVKDVVHGRAARVGVPQRNVHRRAADPAHSLVTGVQNEVRLPRIRWHLAFQRHEQQRFTCLPGHRPNIGSLFRR